METDRLADDIENDEEDNQEHNREKWIVIIKTLFMKKEKLNPARSKKEDLNNIEKENQAASISTEERELLDTSQTTSLEDQVLQSAVLDNKDSDGESLNVSSFAEDSSGRDLDVPGAEEDDDMEDIGEEDEANNPYSLSDNKE